MTASGRDGLRPGATALSGFARRTITELGLAPHPEGGWYRRTWQAGQAVGGSLADARSGENGGAERTARPLASLIYFLLPAGETSAWHVVDADELWLWHGPGSVTLELGGTGEAPDEAATTRSTLGRNANGLLTGQLVVPAGTWQRTLPSTEDALVSCVVSPGFVYAGFSLA